MVPGMKFEPMATLPTRLKLMVQLARSDIGHESWLKRQGGYHGFDPDTKFERDSDDSVSSFFNLTQSEGSALVENAIENNQAEFQNIASDDEEIQFIEENDGSLEQEFTAKDKEKSSTLPRFIWKLHSHHQAISSG